MPTWPATVPLLLRDDFGEETPNNDLRRKTDIGPDKVRRRTTANPRAVSGRIAMADLATKNALETFYASVSTAVGWDWAALAAFTGGGTPQFRFTRPPQYSKRGTLGWFAAVSIERLP